jgi:signal transduction histidine kinase
VRLLLAAFLETLAAIGSDTTFVARCEPMSDSQSDAHFQVDPSVVFQLGEFLISDAIQALLELVKNSYDADSTYVLIRVNTQEPAPGTVYQDSVGYILIEDDGIGMTESVIHEGWLTISNSSKRDFKRRRQLTQRGRTPLGEKGLGRLGVQRLGGNLEIITRARRTDGEPGSKELLVSYSWNDFANARTLAEVPVRMSKAKRPTRDGGTTLIISDLREVEAWTDPRSLDRLQEGLTQLLSPYEEVRDFDVVVSVNGRTLDLGRAAPEIRQAAELHYDIDFDGHILTVLGQAKLSYFRPNGERALREWAELIGSDGGVSFRKFLIDRAAKKGFHIAKASDRGWFVEFSNTLEIYELSTPAVVVSGRRSNGNRNLANPGPFYGKVDAFDLGRETATEQLAFESASAYKQYIRSLSGIRVYRDGFGIRVDRDWLRLSEQYQGKSLYGLRPANTLGYIAISARDNPDLLEKTDREGFQRTAHYDNFESLLREGFVGFSTAVQQFMRKAWNGYRKANAARLAQVSEETAPAALVSRIGSHLAAAAQHRPVLTAYNRDVRSYVGETRGDLNRATATGEFKRLGQTTFATLIGHAREMVLQLDTRVNGAQDEIAKLDSYLESIATLDPTATLISLQLEELQQRVGELLERASLGITAEVLIHEVENVIGHLRDRTAQLRDHLGRTGLRDTKLAGYLNFVDSSLTGIRKQMGHLLPALRFAREERHVIDIAAFLTDLFEHHNARLQPKSIRVSIDDREAAGFSVQMGKGRLSQIFDNLLINAEYWVGRELRGGRVSEGVIQAEIRAPYVRVWDNGPGVDPRYENSLFEPFVSGRAGEGGRGLGLYIVNQFLTSENCAIELLPDRNANGRRYIFEIDFTGALHG